MRRADEDELRERQRAEKRQTAIEAGELLPEPGDIDVTNRIADPTTGAKLDRMLARNALTSLGKSHPANVSRAQRRAAKIRGPLDPMHRELKRRAHGQDGEA